MAAASAPTEVKRHLPKRNSIHRPSSDASRFHMSKAAVDRSVEDVAKWTDLQCVKHLANVRWGSFKVIGCPHCNAHDEHYWSSKELRWKCRGCGKRFSVTSNTVFAYRKLPLQKLLAALHLWASGAAGQPALELRRMLNLGGYNTAFTLVSKLREGLLRGFHTGLVSGVVEMDGAHASGRRASEKRGRPLTFKVNDPEEAQKDALLTSSARSKKRREEKVAALAAGGNVHPEHGTVFPASRRIAFTLRRRSGAKGKGAVVTRVGIGLAETPDVAQALVDAYVAKPESILATDTGTAFKAVGKEFQLHLAVNHSDTLVGPNGEHVNNSEGFTARQDRSEKGVYLNIEPKYLMDYVVETAFREDHRRVAPGRQADRALHFALNIGRSQYWTNFTHGRHRDFEILRPENRPAKASGPAKGRSPVAAQNGRAPR
ncbi:MAG: IS1595 family transposase [Burkholderiales bacterium]|nr:IS1595 family transposase [Burkholderiales bacterium]